MTKIRDDKYLKSLGKKVKKLRKAKDISTYQLSYDTDISRSQINSIEEGSINPTICTLKALSVGLGVKLSELVEI